MIIDLNLSRLCFGQIVVEVREGGIQIQDSIDEEIYVGVFFFWSFILYYFFKVGWK